MPRTYGCHVGRLLGAGPALMLIRSPLALLRLCAICMRHRRDIYPDAAKARGAMGMVRGFFHPMIFAYRCSLFDL